MTEEEKISPQNYTSALVKIGSLNSNHEYFISGSVSEVLSLKAYEQSGIPLLTNDDFREVHDLDIAFNNRIELQTEHQISEISITTGVPIESSLIFMSSTYPESPVKNLTFQEAQFSIDGINCDLKFTTPEFLLLFTLQRDHAQKDVQEKFVRLQAMPSFKKENFLALADYETEMTNRINREVFPTWKSTVLEQASSPWSDDLRDILRKEIENVNPGIDVESLLSKVHTLEDLKNIEYDDVRAVYSIERYARVLRDNTE